MSNRNQEVSGQFGWAPELTKNMVRVLSSGTPEQAALVITSAITQALQEVGLHKSGPDPVSNQPSVYSPSDNPPSASRRFVQKNRNIVAEAQNSLDLQKSEVNKAEQRAKCAQHCKAQGRTACSYCHGAGWDFMSKSEPSKNANVIHKSRNILADSHASRFRNV